MARELGRAHDAHPVDFLLVRGGAGGRGCRRGAGRCTGPRGRARAAAPEVEALEAAKDSKLREIRDAELDYRTGKLSEEDWRARTRELRSEAADLLRDLDRAKGKEG